MLEIVDWVTWEGKDPKPFLVVGFYTVDTPYEDCVKVLQLSLEALGYPHEFAAVKSQGSWQKNTQLKAEFVEHALMEHEGFPLLYLDVDSIVVHAPTKLHHIDCDIAAVHFAKGNELLSGTVYFANTLKCRETVRRWIELNARYPTRLPDGREAWDQRTLQMAITQTRCRFVELPQEYTWIVELTQRHMPGLSPVILHSRGAWRWKSLMNGGKRNMMREERIEKEVKRALES